jgi:hypothetical protein
MKVMKVMNLKVIFLKVMNLKVIISAQMMNLNVMS